MEGDEDNDGNCKCFSKSGKKSFEIFRCLFIVGSCDVSLSLLQKELMDKCPK